MQNSAGRGGAICLERTGRLRLFTVTFRDNAATTAEYAGIGEDIFLMSPKTQFGYPPIEIFGVQTNRRSLRAFMGWPLVIDLRPLTTRCPTGLSAPQVCGEQAVCEDWPRADTFPVRTFGLPTVGVTCRCKPSALVHGATNLEEFNLAPYGAQWSRSAMGAFYGSALNAQCRLDMLVGTVQHESSTVSVTLQKGEQRAINFTLTVRGQGHVPGALYTWRVLAPPYPFGAGRHYIDACHGVRLGIMESNPNTDGACALDADGAATIYDVNASGEVIGRPLSVITAASSFSAEISGIEQSVGIEMLLSAAKLRETRGNKPYKFKSCSLRAMWTSLKI